MGIQKLKHGNNATLPSISVLVPAYNEEANIEQCVQSLVAQDYPRDKFEIVIIDDQSTDATAAIAQKLSQQYSNVRYIRVTEKPHTVSPKINAFRFVIPKTTGELIFTTDADCFVSPQWLSLSAKYFEEHVGVVTGTTLYKNTHQTEKILFGIQFLDFLSHTACAAGAIGNNRVNNCNGSNMAFRRSAYDEVGGFDSMAHLNAGEDSLLAQKIAATKNWSVRFSLEPETNVITNPVQTWKDFFHQRMRWVSQTTEYRKETVFLLVCSFVYYIALTISFLFSIFDFQFFILLVISYVPKFIIDFLILNKFTSLTNTRSLLSYYIFASIIHIPTVLYVVFGGYFGSFQWKGKTVERTS